MGELVGPYDLNPICVAYYRRVRDCLPCLDPAAVRRKVSVLRVLASQIDKQVCEFNQMTADLVDSQVGYTPSAVQFYFSQVAERPEAWMDPREPVHHRSSHEEWRERPMTRAGLDAWNAFLTAMQKQPVRIYRTSQKRENEWEAEFQRQDGSPMFVSLADLTGTQRGPKMEGLFAAASPIEIVDQMLAWLDKEATAIQKRE